MNLSPTTITLIFLAFAVISFVLEKIPLGLTATIVALGLNLTGVRVIVGKGGMKEQTAAACKDFGAIHVVIPAGNAVVAAVAVEEIERAEWRDLGMPETLWNCRVKEFGPLIVSIDAKGRNYFEEKKVEYNKGKDEQIEKISAQVKFIK